MQIIAIVYNVKEIVTVCPLIPSVMPSLQSCKVERLKSIIKRHYSNSGSISAMRWIHFIERCRKNTKLA